ncbi:MAG: hypothetical protein GXO23_03585 [Crenarchaeota archaeon]|nr:hypothetical protein [Thermoproteota archaeon]
MSITDRALTTLIMSIPIGKLHNMFKNREITSEKVDPPFIVRLDGVKFGKRLQRFQRPRDRTVHEALLMSAERIMRYMGAELGYVTSDEINILFLRYSPYSSRYFKIISISSGIASSATTNMLKTELFYDSRIIKVYNIDEIFKYILYRVRTGFNNFVSSLCHIYGKIPREYTPHIQDMICIAMKIRKDIENWELFGTLLYREKYFKTCEDRISGGRVQVRRSRIVRREVSIDVVHELRNIMETLFKS